MRLPSGRPEILANGFCLAGRRRLPLTDAGNALTAAARARRGADRDHPVSGERALCQGATPKSRWFHTGL